MIAPRRRRPRARSRASSGSRPTRASTAAPRWRTALSFVTDHQPGSLYHALGPFARHGLNLVQLVSRPIPHSTFRYRFDMVLDGHPQDQEMQTALVEMREWTREVRIFGSYAATGRPADGGTTLFEGSGTRTSSTSGPASRRCSTSTSISSTR